MTKEEVIKEFHKITDNKKPSIKNDDIKKLFPELYNEIIKLTPELNKFKDVVYKNGKKYLDILLYERVYCIEHNLSTRPICPICKKNHVKFDRQTKLYIRCCCLRCTKKDPLFREKLIKHNLEKYGVKYPQSLESVKEKQRKTNLERYGCEWSLQNEEVRRKSRETYKKKTGYEYNSQNPEFKSMLRKRFLEKYNAPNPFLIKGVLDKSIHTTKIKKWNKMNESKLYSPLFTKDEYLSNTDKFKNFNFKCKKCGETFSSFFSGVDRIIRCPVCDPIRNGSSTVEREFSDYIKSFKFDCILNTRKYITPQELDIVLPDKNIAFEFDGLYWHNELNKPNQNYHFNKTIRCSNMGLRLIHIFEDEWVFKQKQIKHFIHCLINDNYKQFINKVNVSEITNTELNKFLNSNSFVIDRYDSTVSISIKINDEIISVLSFVCIEDEKWKITNRCISVKYMFPNGFDQIISYFIKKYNPKEISIDINRRYETENDFSIYGFIKQYDIQPNYYYTKDLIRLCRNYFENKTIEKIVPEYDPKLSYFENLKTIGYYRIFDAGYIHMVKICK